MQSMQSQRIRHDWATEQQQLSSEVLVFMHLGGLMLGA